MKHKKDRGIGIRYVMPALILCMALALLTALSGSFSKRTHEESLVVLEEAVTKATVLCYSIEGRYPPNITYLEDHYGIVIDQSRYSVIYTGFASNIMPDITVLELEE
ncbi:MAG: hypothetical protein RR466_03475 [Hungatella sp.]